MYNKYFLFSRSKLLSLLLFSLFTFFIIAHKVIKLLNLNAVNACSECSLEFIAVYKDGCPFAEGPSGGRASSGTAHGGC